MNIHVVQQGDTIQTIAEMYQVTVDQLVKDNGLTNSDHLIIGQSILILSPKVIYTIKEGDSLESIAANFQIPLIQLFANNPNLVEREYIYPGDTIVIEYDKKDTITTHGFTYPYIDKTTLIQTLPYLTYLSVINYTATMEGSIISYYDDSEIVEISKNYGVVPLMLLTTLTIFGEPNIRTDFDLILSEEYQNTQIENIITIIKTKGYYGVNISLQYISEANMYLYEAYTERVATRLKQEGYLVFVTINPNLTGVDIENSFAKVDYTRINQLAQNLIFMSYEWATNANQPSPISSINKMEEFLEYVLEFIPSKKVIIGTATIGYDWELPFVPGISGVNSISFERIIDLAFNYGAEIRFDEQSQTPYFRYKTKENVEHIVWFVNVKTIDATLELIRKYDLKGISIWNITIFNPQLWLMINSQFKIVKEIGMF